MMNLYLDKWVGRLGNNLTQLSNAIYLAEQGQCNLKFASHPTIKPAQYKWGTPAYSITKSNSFWNAQIKTLVDMDDIEKNRPRILQEYVLPLLPYIDKDESPKEYKDMCGDLDYDIIIHFRAGDIFEGAHHGYVQSPLSYFLKIFENENPSKMCIVAEPGAEKKNPVINELIKNYNCDYFSDHIPRGDSANADALNRDINRLLNTPIIVAGGKTSFSRLLAQCSVKLKKFYHPIYVSGFTSECSSFAKGEFYTREMKNLRLGLEDKAVGAYHRKYIRISEWRPHADPSQLQFMLTHSTNDIELGL